MGSGNHIVESFRKGNLDVLYDELYRPLLMYAAKCLTESFSFLAEDCVQEAIIRAFRSYGSFYSDNELRSYLYSVVHGKAVDIIRKNSSYKKYLSSAQTESDEILTDIIEHESMNSLFKALSKMTDADQELFFNIFEGLKTSEIAAKMGISESAVKQRKSKLISKLRKEIDDKTPLAIVLLSTFYSVSRWQ